MSTLVNLERPQLQTADNEGDLKYALQRLHTAVQNGFDTLQRKSPTISGILVKGVAVVPGNDATVTHGLSRAINGWHVVRKAGALDMWESTAKNSLPNSQILLTHNASSSTTVDVYVF